MRTKEDLYGSKINFQTLLIFKLHYFYSILKMKEAKQAKGRYLRLLTYNKNFKSKTLFMYEYVGQFLGDFKIRICHFVLVLNTLK